MRSTPRMRMLAGAATLLLAACSGQRTHFYTLVRPAPALAATTAGFAIDVQPLRLPAQVDQPELVVRQGDGAVALVETRRWISPLPEEARGALVAELTRRLGVRDVSRVAAPAELPLYRVLVDVQRLDAWLARGAEVEAVWTVIASGNDARSSRWTCVSATHVDAAAGYEALVLGIQQALDRVAADIAALIAVHRRGGSPQCQAAPATAG